MAEQRELIYKILLDLGNSPEAAKKAASEIDKVTRSANNAADASKRYGQQTKELAKLQENQARSAGLAGAAAFELGRTISDLPFGIVAVTNNISQLGTLFAALSANAKGLGNAFKLLWAQIMGPAGILIAFQIITAAVTFFAKNSTSAKKFTFEFTDSLRLQAAELEIVTNELAKGNLTLEERLDILERYGVISKKTREELELIGLSEEEQNEILAQQNLLLEKRAALEAAKKISEEGQDPEKLRLKTIREQKDVEEELAQLEAERQLRIDVYATARRQGNTTDEKVLEVNQKINDEIDKRRIPLVQRQNELAAQLEATVRSEADLKAEVYEIEQNLVTLTQDRVDLERKRRDAEEAKEESLYSLRKALLEEELDLVEGTSTAAFEERKRIIDRLRNLEIARLKAQQADELRTVKDPQIAAAIVEKYSNAMKQVAINFREQLRGVLLEPIDVLDNQGGIFGLDLIDGKEMTQAQKDAQKQLEVLGDNAMKGFRDFVRNNPRFKKKKKEAEKEFTIEDGLALAQQSLDSLFGLFDAQFEREIALEQAKTIAINDQLRERLRNEKLTAEQRDEINQQIARNDAELLKKQNEIEKKRFELNKAAAISNAIINTASAVVAALDDFPAPANFIAAGIVGAAGAAQIAAIASQQFVPQASPNPRLSALGTGESSGPAFNVVGSSTRNQLAEAVSSALSDKPIKAFVVSSDVSSAQELDRKIIEGASI